MIHMYITIGKTKNKEFIYINQSFRTKNKTTTKIFKKLGTMDELLPLHNNDRDQVINWAKEQARIATENYNKENEIVNLAFHPNLLIKKNEQNSFNCGYLFLSLIHI